MDMRSLPTVALLFCALILGLAGCDGTRGTVLLESDGSTEEDASSPLDGSTPAGDTGACPAQGCPDAGSSDAGFPDGGAVTDGGVVTDAWIDADVGPPPDSGVDPNVQCGAQPPVFPEFDRSCSTDTDCTLGTRQRDCCGSKLVHGIRSEEAEAWNAAAALCASQFPGCACAEQPAEADDGSTLDFMNPLPAQVRCNGGACESYFPSSVDTACGPAGLTCDPATEICVAREPVGPAIDYSCEAIPQGCFENRTCTCAASTLCSEPFSTCFDSGEANQISCICLNCQ